MGSSIYSEKKTHFEILIGGTSAFYKSENILCGKRPYAIIYV